MRSRSSFGLLALIVALVVVALLAARAYRAIAPTAVEAVSGRVAGPDTQNPGDNAAVDGDGTNISLREMDAATSSHASDLEDALESAQ